MNFSKNLFANYIGSGLVIVIPIIILPWQLKLLGPEQFGLLSLAGLLQTLLSLLDAGMSQALMREFSIRFDNTPDGLKRCAELLSGFERVYWFITILLTLIILLISPFLINFWSNNDHKIQRNDLNIILYGAVSLFAVQFPGCLYRGFLIGLNKHILFNKILSISIFFRNFFGIALLYFWPTLITFFLWNIFVTLLDTITRVKFSWKILYPETILKNKQWSVELKKSQSTVTKLTLSVLLGALTTNIDKIILSHMVSMKDFGYYTISATIAMGILQAVYPLIQTLLPTASKLVTQAQHLKSLYIKTTIIILMVFSIVYLLIFFYGEEILYFWLKSQEAVNLVYYFLQFLLIGTFINALYNIGYVNWLIKNKTSYILYVNIIGIIITIFLTPLCINHYGTAGAAIGWSMVSFIGFILSINWLWKT